MITSKQWNNTNVSLEFTQWWKTDDIIRLCLKKRHPLQSLQSTLVYTSKVYVLLTEIYLSYIFIWRILNYFLTTAILSAGIFYHCILYQTHVWVQKFKYLYRNDLLTLRLTEFFTPYVVIKHIVYIFLSQ